MRTKLKSGPHFQKKAGFVRFNERPLKMMNNAVYFILKALFVSKIFKFCSDLFGYVEKQIDKNAKVNFKIYDATKWNTNNYYKHIARYLKK